MVVVVFTFRIGFPDVNFMLSDLNFALVNELFHDLFSLESDETEGFPLIPRLVERHLKLKTVQMFYRDKGK